jgi:hypothetical protein
MGGENQFVFFTTYLFVGGMICTLVLQTDLLNRAIMTGDTLSVFPMFQCFWIGVRQVLPHPCSCRCRLTVSFVTHVQSSVIGGVVYYEKYERFTVFEWVCLPIALACTSSIRLGALANTQPSNRDVFVSSHHRRHLPAVQARRGG